METAEIFDLPRPNEILSRKSVCKKCNGLHTPERCPYEFVRIPESTRWKREAERQKDRAELAEKRLALLTKTIEELWKEAQKEGGNHVGANET